MYIVLCSFWEKIVHHINLIEKVHVQKFQQESCISYQVVKSSHNTRQILEINLTTREALNHS